MTPETATAELERLRQENAQLRMIAGLNHDTVIAQHIEYRRYIAKLIKLLKERGVEVVEL